MKDVNGQLIPRVGVVFGIRFSRLVTPEWAIGLATQNFGMGINVAYGPVHCLNPKTGSQGLPRDLAAEYIVDNAIRNDAPYIMFLDDDVELPFGACRHLMQTLASADDDVMAAGGIYVTKQNPPEPVVFKDISFGAFWRWKRNTVFPCELLGLGCTLFKTEVFKRIPKPWFRDIDTEKMSCTDDAFFFAKMKLNGFKALADAYVLPTHWDYETGKGYQLPEDSYPMLPEGKESILKGLPEGWMTMPELEWLSEQASQRHNIVELGCFKGRSTVAMARSTPGKVWAVDDWKGPRRKAIVGADNKIVKYNVDHSTLLSEFRRNISQLENVECIVSDHALVSIPVTPDMVFIDGDHEYESVKRDIVLWKEKIASGGLLCGHDRDWDGVKQALAEVLPDWKPGPGTLWSVTL